jgi:hypothetical protein
MATAYLHQLRPPGVRRTQPGPQSALPLFADPLSAWIFLPYLGYMIHALKWSRRGWQLDRMGPVREAAWQAHLLGSVEEQL